MRFLGASGIAGIVLLCAGPAHAEFPLSLRAVGGSGIGFATSDAVGTGAGGILALDLVVRRGPDRAYRFSYDFSGVMGDAHSGFDETVQRSVVVGVERHAIGSGVTRFAAAGLGVGIIDERVAGRLIAGTRLGPGAGGVRRHAGVAASAEVGWRMLPRPGPLGFLLSVRTSHLIGASAQGHAIALCIGFVLRPLESGEPVKVPR